MSRPELGKSRIVIVGGGAGGLELATRLGDKYGRKGQLDVTLIERNRTHVWKPKLHEIAAGSMDLAAHEVMLGSRLITLTSREYDLLAFLMRHPRQAFSREELLTQVWNWSFGDSSTVTVHVRRLREKIEHDPALPRRIVTVWGFGYRYELEDA